MLTLVREFWLDGAMSFSCSIDPGVAGLMRNEGDPVPFPPLSQYLYVQGVRGKFNDSR